MTHKKGVIFSQNCDQSHKENQLGHLRKQSLDWLWFVDTEASLEQRHSEKSILLEDLGGYM